MHVVGVAHALVCRTSFVPRACVVALVPPVPCCFLFRSYPAGHCRHTTHTAQINRSMVEMYADPSARGGVLEPEGIVEIKFRTPDLLAAMHRLDPVLHTLKVCVCVWGGASHHIRTTCTPHAHQPMPHARGWGGVPGKCNHVLRTQKKKYPPCYTVSCMQTCFTLHGAATTPHGFQQRARVPQEQGAPASAVQQREKALLPAYTQVATCFAELHDTPTRMLAKGVLRGIVPWARARTFFHTRLRRRCFFPFVHYLQHIGLLPTLCSCR